MPVIPVMAGSIKQVWSPVQPRQKATSYLKNTSGGHKQRVNECAYDGFILNLYMKIEE
jgi:hypothetical protein